MWVKVIKRGKGAADAALRYIDEQEKDFSAFSYTSNLDSFGSLWKQR